MIRTTVFLAATALALTACAPIPGGDDGHGKNVPAARATGPARSCIPLTSIRESRVRDDWTIDFDTGGGKWYRVALPQRCNGLATYRTFKYETSLGELCNTDIITVMELGGPGGGPRGSCGMGMFQPVEIAK
jgi:hypothetical protein